MEKDEQKVVVVTGGAGGIGSAISEKFYKKDCKVIILEIDEVRAKEICAKFPGMEYYNCDVTDYEKLDSIANDIKKRFGSVTHLVNVAGKAFAGEFGVIEKVDHSVMDKSIQLNLTSHLYIISRFVELFNLSKFNNKSITLISSINAVRTFGRPAYSAAKSGMYGVVKGLSKDLGRKGIRINAVSPGTVITDLTKSEGQNFDNYLKCCLLNKFPEPKEIAEAVYMFAFKLPSVTAQLLTVDAGQTMFLPDLD